MEEQITQGNEKQDGNKVEKRFNANMEKLMAIFKGDESIFVSKVANDQMDDLIKELLKEKKETTEKDVKEALRMIVDKKVGFDKFCRQKKQEMQQAINARMEEFNKEIEAVFTKIQDVNQMLRDYKTALSGTPKVEE